MEKTVLNKILDAQDAALADPVYLELMREYKSNSCALRRLLSELDPGQQEILLNYLELWTRMHLRLMELLCKENYKNTHDL